MVDITFLGTGGGMPMPFRHLSSLMINYEGRKILIDCGEGCQIWIREYGLGFKSIDVIFITHGHGDHVNGLSGLLATIGNSGREEELTIIGPRGIKEIVDGLMVTARYIPYSINIIECDFDNLNFKIQNKRIIPSDEQTSEISISTLPLEHSIECIGARVEIKRRARFNKELAEKNNVPKILWSRLQKGEEIDFEGRIYGSNLVLGEKRRGIIISYITDSRPIDSIVDFIKESDLFICEGTYGDDNDLEKAIKNKHMTFREGATLAQKANIKELIFTHYSPALLNPEEFINNATDVFENSALANDGMKKVLNFID